MGGWYRVFKTIKGNRYAYLQQTYREGGRVRTRNRYLGRAELSHKQAPKVVICLPPQDLADHLLGH